MRCARPPRSWPSWPTTSSAASRNRRRNPNDAERGVKIATRPVLLVLLVLIFAGGCGHRRGGIPTSAPAPPPDTSPFPEPKPIPTTPGAPLRLIEEGNASWYGV